MNRDAPFIFGFFIFAMVSKPGFEKFGHSSYSRQAQPVSIETKLSSGTKNQLQAPRVVRNSFRMEASN